MASNNLSAEQPPVPQSNYQRILQEIDSGEIRQDVWVEAYGKANGNYNKAVSIYISIRADQLYKENTTFFRRTGDKVVQQLNPKDQRGKWIVATAVALVLVGIFLGIQPMLRGRAMKGYTRLYTKARDLSLAGKNQNFVLQNFGEPEATSVNAGSVCYLYNPASKFCLGRDKYQFKIMVDAQTAKVSLWEWNSAFNFSDSN